MIIFIISLIGRHIPMVFIHFHANRKWARSVNCSGSVLHWIEEKKFSGKPVERKKNLSDMHFCTITRFYLVVHRGEVTWASANLHSLARAGRHCTVKIVRVNWCMWTQRDHIAHPFVMLMTQWPFYNNKLQQVYELRSMNCSESNPSRTRAYEMSESSLCQNRVIFTSNRAVISRIFGLYPRTLIVGTGGRTRP